MGKLFFNGLLMGLLILSTSSVSVAYDYDLESGTTPAAISGGTLMGTENYPANFGEYFQWSEPGSAITLQLDSLVAHSTLDLAFDLAIIDSWDGDTFYGPDYFNLKVDGVSYINELVIQDWDNGSDMWGNPDFPDSSISYSFSITHFATSVSIEWFANGSGWQGGLDESFAIDNIYISAQSETPVPEPATVLLFGTGLVGLAGIRFRKKKK